jgi:hypothetical protein
MKQLSIGVGPSGLVTLICICCLFLSALHCGSICYVSYILNSVPFP